MSGGPKLESRKGPAMNARTSFDSDRRRFLAGGAALAGSAMSGCCSFPTQTIAGVCSPSPAPFLAGPEVVRAWAGPQRYFDAHTHFFNAADVPVEQFLVQSVAHSIQDERIRRLVIALAPVAAALAHLAPTPRAEMTVLCSAGADRRLTADAAASGLDAAIEARRRDTADALYDEIARRSSEIPAIVDGAVVRTRGARPDSQLLRSAPSGFSRDFVRESLSLGSSVRDEATQKIQPYSLRTLRLEEVQLAQIRNALQFVGFMLSPRHHNLRTYIQRFAEGSPDTPISGCFAAMVDFNYWLDCPAKASNMRDQVLLHEQMALQSRGFLLPVVGYNPWVDIVEKDASLETVKWAVQEHGCVGVKIYPPMGYYPYGNDGHPLPGSSAPRPDLKLLDQKLARLYETCEDLGVPVMAHDNQSNGRDAASDDLAAATGWIRADQALEKVRKLYVNAGHFGGALDHDGPEGDWTLRFVRLMQSATKLKLYGDLGFWDELITSERARMRLRELVRMPVGAGATVADRTMYGSDWLMLSQTPGWESYADGIAAVLRSDGGGSLVRRVMGANVLECYGLTEASGRQNLARLQAYCSAPGRTLPGWMRPAP